MGVIGKMLMHIFQYPVIAPAGKAIVDTIPTAVHFRQQAPLGSTASYPQYSF